MSIMNQLIKYVRLDENKRILVSVQPHFQSYLQENKNRQMIKNAVMSILKDEFERLEIGKNICRITVKKGTEDKNLQIVKTELAKGLEMALKYMGK